MRRNSAILNYSDWGRLANQSRIQESRFNSIYLKSHLILEDQEHLSLIPDWLEATQEVVWSGHPDEGNTTVWFINSTPSITTELSPSGVKLVRLEFKGAKCLKSRNQILIEKEGSSINILWCKSDQPWYLFENKELTGTNFYCKPSGGLYSKIKQVSGETSGTAPSVKDLPEGANAWAEKTFNSKLWKTDQVKSWMYISLYNLKIIDQAKTDLNKNIKLPKFIILKEAGIDTKFSSFGENARKSVEAQKESVEVPGNLEMLLEGEKEKKKDGEGDGMRSYILIDTIVFSKDYPHTKTEEDLKLEKRRAEYENEGYMAKPRAFFTGRTEDWNTYLIVNMETPEIVISIDRKTGKFKTWLRNAINALQNKTTAAYLRVVTPNDDKSYKAYLALQNSKSDMFRALNKWNSKVFPSRKECFSRTGLLTVRRMYDENRISKKELNQWSWLLYDWDYELHAENERIRKAKEKADRGYFEIVGDELLEWGSDVQEGIEGAADWVADVGVEIGNQLYSGWEGVRDAADWVADGFERGLVSGAEAVEYLGKMADVLAKSGVYGSNPALDLALNAVAKTGSIVGEIKDISQDPEAWAIEKAEGLLTPYGIKLILEEVKVEITEMNNPVTTGRSELVSGNPAPPTVVGKLSGSIGIEIGKRGTRPQTKKLQVNGSIELDADINLLDKKLKVSLMNWKMSTSEINLGDMFDEWFGSFVPNTVISGKSLYLKWYNPIEDRLNQIRKAGISIPTGTKILYETEVDLESGVNSGITKSLRKYDGYDLEEKLKGIPNIG